MLWKDKYALGDALIDSQHRELFDRVSVFVETLRSPTEWEEKVRQVNDTLSFMTDYVVTHFRDEEEYQEKLGYPGREEHKKVHGDMVSYVTQIASRYEQEGYDERIIQQFAGKLLSWLIHHVATEDMKIAQWAMEKGAVRNA